MSAFSGGFDKVNGAALAGEFLSGSMVFYTIQTLVPMFQTNVSTPVQYLYTQQGYSTWQSVTVIDGTGTSQTYNTQSAYQDAYNQQANFDYMVKAFSTRANPVILNITQASVSNPAASTYTGYSYQTGFGSSFTGVYNVNTVTFSTERGSLWLVSGSAAIGSGVSPGPDSNAGGYQLLDTLAAVPNGVIVDLATPVLNTSYVGFIVSTAQTGFGGSPANFINTIATVSATYNSAP